MIRPVAFAAVAASVVAPMAATACSSGDGDPSHTAGTVASTADMAAVEAWVRPSPPNVDEAAFYITVVNHGDTDDQIIGAASDRCTVVTPHTTTFDDNIASMGEAVGEQLALPAGGRVDMAPNGLHLMCLGLTEPLADGETVRVVINFEHREPLSVPVTVTRSAPDQ